MELQKRRPCSDWTVFHGRHDKKRRAQRDVTNASKLIKDMFAFYEKSMFAVKMELNRKLSMFAFLFCVVYIMLSLDITTII